MSEMKNKNTVIETEKKSTKNSTKLEKALAELEQTKQEMSEKDKKIQALLDSVEQLKQLLVINKASQPVSTDVTLVYTASCPGYLFVEGTGLALHFNGYGDTYVISRSQLDALIGKYRRWFDDGRLALSDKDVAVAAEKGVPTAGELALSREKLNQLGSMSVGQLEALWHSIDKPTQKSSLVLFYKRKFIENTEPGYRDRAKIDLLNRLTDNGFSREAVEVSGIVKNQKIAPTEFM